jgi:hypothetical protein
MNVAPDHQALDPRVVLMARAAARLTLVELDELDLDNACEGLIDEMWTFWRACERADAAPNRQPVDPKIGCVWRLLDDTVSLDRAYAIITANRPTPETSIDAIKVAVRDRGVAALNEPATRQRLQRCDAAARADIEQWLSRFKQRLSHERISQDSTKDLERT